MTLKHETNRMQTLDLMQMVQRGQLLPAGPPGGPSWDAERRAQLFTSLKAAGRAAPC